MSCIRKESSACSPSRTLPPSMVSPATFLAGSEIPIPIPGPDGQTFIDYKEVGVSLEYLPTLLPGNRINLRLRPEVSSPNSTGGVIIDGFQIPSFTVRRTDTSVELTSGQTMALAGLFQRDVSTDVNKFPILGDLPILGKLFRSERYQRAETELVILITPYLVQPTNVTNVIGPNDRIDTPQKPLTRNSKQAACRLHYQLIGRPMTRAFHNVRKGQACWRSSARFGHRKPWRMHRGAARQTRKRRPINSVVESVRLFPSGDLRQQRSGDVAGCIGQSCRLP